MNTPRFQTRSALAGNTNKEIPCFSKRWYSINGFEFVALTKMMSFDGGTPPEKGFVEDLPKIVDPKRLNESESVDSMVWLVLNDAL